ncbi:hypothetical protein V6N13_083418 [Hibiscus sabdariffa]|uniref:Uncharacterized protein n=1 Tax=Hibiscus sabdariffa TaxID=183260 RepID=A0ABR2SYR9_9ROSI
MATKQLKNLSISERRIKKVKRKLKAAREEVSQKIMWAENRYREIVQIRREMIQPLILATSFLLSRRGLITLPWFSFIYVWSLSHYSGGLSQRQL